ncbi:MAG: hypothetical protein AAF938_29715, partial [Myxococcota bacterium]
MPRVPVLLALTLTACAVEHTGLGFVQGATTDGAVGDRGVEIGAADVGVDAAVDAAVEAGPDLARPEAGTDTADCPVICLDSQTIQTCPGGVPTRTPCPVDCVDTGGTARCRDLAPTNVPRDVFDSGADQTLDFAPPGNWGDTPADIWDTSDCGSILGIGRALDLPERLGLCVVPFRNLTLNGVVEVRGSRALVLVASGEMTINGIIRADAKGRPGGPGGGRGANGDQDARGPFAGRNGRRENDFFFPRNDSGGSGGGNAFAGGPGGGAGR